MKALSIYSIFLLMVFACAKTDDDKAFTLRCGDFVKENTQQYATAASSTFTIDTAYFNENCLAVKIYASGCSGDTWEVNLFDSGAYMESLLPQRNIRLVLKNEEFCNTIVSKLFTFDLQPVLGMDNAIAFNLQDWQGALLYQN